MLVKTHRCPFIIGKGSGEAGLLAEALKNVLRRPSDVTTRMGKAGELKFKKLGYTYEGLTFVDKQFYHLAFPKNGLKSQASLVSTAGGPSIMERNEIPEVGFKQ